MDNNTARQQVLNVLGDKEGSAGKAIVDFVDQTISEALHSNREKIAALITEFNETNNKALELKADKADIDQINGRLRAAADALYGASSAHDAAARSLNANSASAKESAQEAKAATSQADVAVSDATLTLESLNERLQTMEDWRKNTADPMLEAHEKWINEQKRKQQEAVAVPLIGQPPAPAHEDVHAQHEPVHTQSIPLVAPAHRHREVVDTHRRSPLNPRHWGWIQWVLAIALALGAWVTVGQWVSDAFKPFMHEWSLLWQILISAIAFFGGGWLGSLWDQREQEQEQVHHEHYEREYTQDHTAHRVNA
ncbi:hypothetical protein D3C85_626920 [compost metagenome]